MMGRALIKSLSAPSVANAFQPQVFTLVRRQPANDTEVYWDPYEMRIDVKKCEGFDAVVHLAGENVGSGEGILAATGRWTERKKYDIMESRRRGTLLLSQTLAILKRRPRVLVSASGVGYYGSAGDVELTEAAPKGRGFLSDVADVWEQNTRPAAEAGIRVVNLRFGIVLSRRGGVVAKLYWPFFAGGGGPIGSGSQYWSWISLADAVRVIEHAITKPALAGKVNACAPNPVPNVEFARALGAAMHRPAFVPLPEFVVRTVFGEMAEETMLASQRCVPRVLTESGFSFMHPDINSALRFAVDDA